jgi:hypothetical protein
MTNSLEPSGHFSSEPSTTSAAWRWRFEDSAGAEASPAGVGSPEFPSQSDAESWVGESWHELLDAGVDAVTLFEGDREVYGPMSLHAS